MSEHCNGMVTFIFIILVFLILLATHFFPKNFIILLFCDFIFKHKEKLNAATAPPKWLNFKN